MRVEYRGHIYNVNIEGGRIVSDPPQLAEFLNDMVEAGVEVIYYPGGRHPMGYDLGSVRMFLTEHTDGEGKVLDPPDSLPPGVVN